MIDKKFHNLLVINRADKKRISGKTMWTCRCDCGKETISEGYKIRSGQTKSCGCILGINLITHGKYKHILYKTWESMKQRCYNKNHKNYKNYGGRGIIVCDRWKNNFQYFLDDMESSNENGLELDRIDNNGNYEPKNCRWITRKQQCNNMSKNRFIKYKGEELTISQWCEKLKINRNTLYNKIRKMDKDKNTNLQLLLENLDNI